MTHALVLASQSPRRVELMQGAGYDFETLPVDVDEAHDAALTPEQLTIDNATQKAVAGSRLRAGAIVIGADTLVYLDGEPLGKPRDMAEAVSMLKKLSGKPHHVCTGMALARDGAIVRQFAVISHVVFRPLTDEVIRDYYSKINPLDKAGAYAIQEHGQMIVDHTEGSWSNIVGLPMERLSEVLAEFGILSGKFVP
ncbi:MAG: Maf family protein [Verrucomicrobiaceae bacterium]|nr:Maf family protein [Verrucomicrobiaceae bacterium]